MMVYEWGTKLVEPTQEVTKDYTAKVGDYMQYWADNKHITYLWYPKEDFEKEIVVKLADKIRAEGQAPIYVSCDLYFQEADPYGVVTYKYYILWQLKILKASPIPWAWIIAGILVAIISYILATSAEKVWKIIVEAGEKVERFLGLPAGSGVPIILIAIVAVIIMIFVGLMSLVRR